MNLQSYSNADFQRGAPAWKEAAWILVRSLIFLSSLPYPSSLKVFLLRCFGAKIGQRVVVRSQVNISFPWRLSVGEDVWIGDGVGILSLAPVTIESNVCVSQRAYLCTGSHDYRKETFDLITRPIDLRAGSWIAAQAFVGPGVEIGAGSVVAAGSVVMKSVASRVLVGGNPAAVIRSL